MTDTILQPLHTSPPRPKRTAYPLAYYCPNRHRLSIPRPDRVDMLMPNPNARISLRYAKIRSQPIFGTRVLVFAHCGSNRVYDVLASVVRQSHQRSHRLPLRPASVGLFLIFGLGSAREVA